MDHTDAPHAATSDTDLLVRRSTITVVVLVAVGAAFVSYRHAYELVHTHGEDGTAAVVGPATVDGLIYAAGMVLLNAARLNRRPPRLAWFGLWLGIVATIGANVAHGLGHGPIGALVSAWPALALIISYELLMRLIRSSHTGPRHEPEPDDSAAENPCPHGVATTVRDAVLNAHAHGQQCLGDAPSQRQLAAAFNVDRKKVAAWLDEVAQPDPATPSDPVAPRPINGHLPAAGAPADPHLLGAP